MFVSTYRGRHVHDKAGRAREPMFRLDGKVTGLLFRRTVLHGRRAAMMPGRDDASIPSMSKRGFAALDPEKQREIARLGGKAAHAQGKAH